MKTFTNFIYRIQLAFVLKNIWDMFVAFTVLLGISSALFMIAAFFIVLLSATSVLFMIAEFFIIKCL